MPKTRSKPSSRRPARKRVSARAAAAFGRKFESAAKTGPVAGEILPLGPDPLSVRADDAIADARRTMSDRQRLVDELRALNIELNEQLSSVNNQLENLSGPWSPPSSSPLSNQVRTR